MHVPHDIKPDRCHNGAVNTISWFASVYRECLVQSPVPEEQHITVQGLTNHIWSGCRAGTYSQSKFAVACTILHFPLTTSPFWVDPSPSIWLWQHQNCQHLSLVQRTNAALTPAKLSMLQVKCCQQQLKCNCCCFRSLETLVAAWKLLKQTITRYRPLQQLECSTCATHMEGQTRHC